MHLCISLSTFPVHASTQFTAYFPCACIYAFHSVLALCISLCAFPMHASMHFTVAIELCTTTLPEKPFVMLSGKKRHTQLCADTAQAIPTRSAGGAQPGLSSQRTPCAIPELTAGLSFEGAGRVVSWLPLECVARWQEAAFSAWFAGK